MPQVIVALLCALTLPLLLGAGGTTATERRLHPSHVEASTFLWNDWNRFQENYHPLYVADGDPKTAWVEGAAGSGAKEWIRLSITPMEGATSVRLRLRNGYQKSTGLFAANARVKELRVVLLPGGAKQTVTLKDAEGWQDVVVAQPPGKLSAVEMHVVSVYEGKKYADLCLSDVQLFATATTRDNPSFEKSRLQAILAWKQERAAAARLFRSATARSMPISPQYRLVAEPGSQEEMPDGGYDCAGTPDCFARQAIDMAGRKQGSKHAAALAIARGVFGKEFGTWAPAHVVSVDQRKLPAVDGLRSTALPAADGYGYMDAFEMPLLDTLGSLRADQLGVFDLKPKDAPTFAEALAAKPIACKKGATYAWVKRTPAPVEGPGAKASVRALALVQCGMIEERDGFSLGTVFQVAVYDEKGRLEVLAGNGYAEVFEWRERPEGAVLASGIRYSSIMEDTVRLEEVPAGAAR